MCKIERVCISSLFADPPSPPPEDAPTGSAPQLSRRLSPEGGPGAQADTFLPAGDAAAPHNRWRLGGLGFGLPLSRLYARYFGGDLRLVNMRGYGVDAFLSVAHLADGGWSEPACEAEGFAGAVLPPAVPADGGGGR